MSAVRRIIIVTAVHGPSAHFLPEAFKSLCEQELPEGWEWHWVIQEDGRGEVVSRHVPDDRRVTFAQGRAGGPGTARTMALAHADGEYVKVLDADDQLPAGALARDLAALEENPEIGWATSRVLDLLPDGSTAGFPGDPEAGPIDIGAVLEFWKANSYRAQVHPATLFVRRSLLLALGGWMALPASEDTGLLLALNATSRGWFSPDVGLLYRKWEGQMTGQASHTDATEREARMAVVESRARELAHLRWQYPVTG
ncbi:MULTISPECIES: glycosyltransferase family 2 protein [Streptomyces]|uniref:Glycosyltransferase family 2 protein n=2 Tax=Streptomyces anulatus TaxID=1892 RepID=A0A6G3ST10_STRAQ|nr:MULTISPECIES: glycosyltransferase family 2 protein [Streptomyces]NEB86003.1 glycosyltransferase family 2 protein [Streptomyces anulatus]OWA24000.1 glycosyltransferase [Streptomyces sp. CS057]